ncbi:hypothetical protein [Fructobacillus americanaquae]|uniref:Uncharacterized protein n=1 Tax=Fructobacillus americanaquae TaxID=2940302 RepID=A0ABY5C0M5_9LACO|nr:hypothetical protein [Fructobacillus americanaquae]USS92285.1 hypothetical protein M3M36_01325 [Fructobacillus americanaquae]
MDAIKATTNSKVPLTKLAISPVKDGTKVTRVGGVVIAADLIGSSKKSMVALVKRNDQKPVSSVLQPVEETKVTAQTKQLPLGFPENNDTKTNVSESPQKQDPVIHNNDLPVPNNEIGSSFSQSNLVSVLPQTNQQVNNRQSVKALILTVWLTVLTGFGLTKKQPDGIG